MKQARRESTAHAAGARRWMVRAVALLALLPMVAAAQALRIDPARSHADFRVRVFWVRSMGGRFDRVGGHVDLFDHGRSMQVQAWIDTTSVDMHKPRYERWLLSPQFFDAARYPRIRFLSGEVPTAELVQGGIVHGLVTIRGVTRAVDFRMSPDSCPQPGILDCRVQLRGRIDRSDFGIDSHRTIISDRVKLDLVITLRPVGVATPFGQIGG